MKTYKKVTEVSPYDPAVVMDDTGNVYRWDSCSLKRVKKGPKGKPDYGMWLSMDKPEFEATEGVDFVLDGEIHPYSMEWNYSNNRFVVA